jgi:hypothetical protein
LLVPYLISRTVLKRYTNLLESPHDTSWESRNSSDFTQNAVQTSLWVFELI